MTLLQSMSISVAAAMFVVTPFVIGEIVISSIAQRRRRQRRRSHTSFAPTHNQEQRPKGDYMQREPNPIMPWVPGLYKNLSTRPTDKMMYALEHYGNTSISCAAGVELFIMYYHCLVSIPFPRALPIELKGIAV